MEKKKKNIKGEQWLEKERKTKEEEADETLRALHFHFLSHPI